MMESLFDKFERANWDNVKYKIVFFATAAFLICTGSYFYHGATEQAVISSARLMLSSIIFAALGADSKETQAAPFRIESVSAYVVFFASVNAIIALWQLLNGVLGYPALPAYLSSGYFWGIPQREVFRVAGLLNSYQTSAALSFFALVLINTVYKVRWRDAISILLIIPIIFGGRTYIPLLIILIILFNRRIFIYVTSVILVIFYYYGISDLGGLESYIENRLVPVFEVAFTLNFEASYSFADTMSHYRLPDEIIDLLLGNGHDRYSWLGGKDPFLSRWLNQGGVFVAFLYIALQLLLCLCLISKFRIVGVFLSLAIIASGIKGELATATLAYDMFLFLCAFVERLPQGAKMEIEPKALRVAPKSGV